MPASSSHRTPLGISTTPSALLRHVSCLHISRAGAPRGQKRTEIFGLESPLLDLLIEGIFQVLPPNGDGIALDDFGFNTTGGQGNQSMAELQIEGAGAGGIGPFAISISSGETLDLDWTGPPDIGLILLIGPLNVGAAVIPGLGSLDLGTPPSFPDLGLVFDGTVLPASLFFSTGPSGTASHSFAVPTLPLGLTFSLQGAVQQPPGATPFGLLLTAAFTILLN